MKTGTQIGRNIRSMRKVYGETQEGLALSINVGISTISQYENGSNGTENRIRTDKGGMIYEIRK